MNIDYIKCSLFPYNHKLIDIDIQNNINSFILNESKKYMWNCEKLIFYKKEELTSNNSKIYYLYSHVLIGDNIDDEWYIVYLVFQLTKLFDVTASIIDTDGEFILIHCADLLPRWLNPDKSKNRIFIYKEKLHIIQYPNKYVGLNHSFTNVVSVNHGLQIIWNPKVNTIACDSIQNSIQEKISIYSNYEIYSEDIGKQDMRCLLVKDVSKILKLCPSLISLSIDSISEKDKLDIIKIHKMENFTPNEMTNSYCLTRFTRFLYAKINSKSLRMPNIFSSNGYSQNYKDKYFKENELGMKICCGFEIIYQKYKRWIHSNINKRDFFKELITEENIDKIVSESYLEWKEFLFNYNKIKEKSDINEMELKIAFLYYVAIFNREYWNHLLKDILKLKVLEIPYFVYTGKFIDFIIKSIDIDINNNIENLPKSDKTSWLNISIEELDKKLKVFGDNKKQNSIYNDKSYQKKEGFNPDSLIGKMNDFVNKVSNYEGAEFPDDEYDSDNDILDEHNSQDEQKKITDELNENLDDDTIIKSVMNEMDKEISTTSLSKSFNQNNIDYNLLKNMLSSYKNQAGGPGPVSNLLGSMGIDIPEDINSDENKEEHQ